MVSLDWHMDIIIKHPDWIQTSFDLIENKAKKKKTNEDARLFSYNSFICVQPVYYVTRVHYASFIGFEFPTNSAYIHQFKYLHTGEALPDLQYLRVSLFSYIEFRLTHRIFFLYIYVKIIAHYKVITVNQPFLQIIECRYCTQYIYLALTYLL